VGLGIVGLLRERGGVPVNAIVARVILAPAVWAIFLIAAYHYHVAFDNVRDTKWGGKSSLKYSKKKDIRRIQGGGVRLYSQMISLRTGVQSLSPQELHS
jgi:hypothetical protein